MTPKQAFDHLHTKFDLPDMGAETAKAWQTLEAMVLSQQATNSAIVSALQFLRDSVPSAMESYPQALSLISQLEERLNNIVTSQCRTRCMP